MTTPGFSTIWKFRLGPDLPFVVIDMPKNAHVLCVHEQRGLAYLWAVVDPEAETEKRHFNVYGTGHDVHPLTPKAGYLGTFYMDDATLVFHVFEVTPQ